jgi:hypothetical protein
MEYPKDKVTGKTIGNYQRMVEFINSVIKHTCCLCGDCCMSCDAKKLLTEIGEYRECNTNTGG